MQETHYCSCKGFCRRTVVKVALCTVVVRDGKSLRRPREMGRKRGELTDQPTSCSCFMPLSTCRFFLFMPDRTAIATIPTLPWLPQNDRFAYFCRSRFGVVPLCTQKRPTQVVVHLTKEGQARWKDVAALVHAHARLARKLPPDDAKRAWQESRDMGAIYLRFQQASNSKRGRHTCFCSKGPGCQYPVLFHALRPHSPTCQNHFCFSRSPSAFLFWTLRCLSVLVYGLTYEQVPPLLPSALNCFSLQDSSNWISALPALRWEVYEFRLQLLILVQSRLVGRVVLNGVVCVFVSKRLTSPPPLPALLFPCLPPSRDAGDVAVQRRDQPLAASAALPVRGSSERRRSAGPRGTMGSWVSFAAVAVAGFKLNSRLVTTHSTHLPKIVL